MQLDADARRRIGVREQRRPDRDVACARSDELERVETRADSAHADDRHPGRAVAGGDRVEGDGLQRRARKTAMPRAERRAQGPRIELQPADRVHEREPVGARRLRGLRNLAAVRNCRRQLGPERLARREARSGDDLRCALGRRLDVRTGDVELDCAHTRVVVEARAKVGVIVSLEPADRHPQRYAELLEPRQHPRQEAVDAGIRQPDRVEHADVGLGNPHRRVAVARQRSHRLGHEGVQPTCNVGSHERVETA